MTAALTWWQNPPTNIPIRLPRRVEAGKAPEMVMAPGGYLTPLISPKVHATFCGFTSVTAHPLTKQLVRCSGCRCWLPVNPLRAVAR